MSKKIQRAAITKTVRVIGSECTIELPIWVRKRLDLGPTRSIRFTPINGMLLLTDGGEYELNDYSIPHDITYIPTDVMDRVGLKPYDLVEILKLRGDVYIAKYVIDADPKCNICGCNDEPIIDFNNVFICSTCFEKSTPTVKLSVSYGKISTESNCSFLCRVETRHRITIPKEISEITNINPGDHCYVSYDLSGIQLTKNYSENISNKFWVSYNDNIALVRKVDKRRRMGLPVEMMRALGIHDGDNLLMEYIDGKIKIRKVNLIYDYDSSNLSIDNSNIVGID